MSLREVPRLVWVLAAPVAGLIAGSFGVGPLLGNFTGGASRSRCTPP